MYAPLQKKLHRILIVEDDPAVRWTLALLFQRHDIETDVAESGREAVRLLTLVDRHYCAVLLDLNIPPPDGIELAKFIRDNVPDTPVVVISGHVDLAAQINNADLGSVVKLVVMKPVDTAFLVRYVHGDHFCIRQTPPNAPMVKRVQEDLPLTVEAQLESPTLRPSEKENRDNERNAHEGSVPPAGDDELLPPPREK